VEKISRVSIGVFAVFLLLPAWALALEVGMARLQDGEVRVMGKGAARDASISWQGAAVTTSTGGGSHPFIKPEEPQRYYWSSTTYPFIPSTAWIVRIFQDGYQDRSVKADTNLVIAVRGGI